MFDCSKVVPKKCNAVCCHNAPIPIHLWEKHKGKAVNKDVKVIEFKGRPEYVLPLTIDLRCPFSDPENDFKCVIYEDRPPVCRKYGLGGHKFLMCPYLKPNGNKRGKKIRNKMLKFVEEDLVEVAERLGKMLVKKY